MISLKAIIQQTRHANIASLSHYGQNNLLVADSALQDSFASYYKSPAHRASENAPKNKRKGPKQTSETAKRSKPRDETMLRLERENHQLREELATFRAHLLYLAPPIFHQTPRIRHQMMPPQPPQPLQSPLSPLSHYPMHQQQFQHYPFPPLRRYPIIPIIPTTLTIVTITGGPFLNGARSA